MSSDARLYAENTLKVHEVYEEARSVLLELDERLGALDKAQDIRRDLLEKIADAEADLVNVKRGLHPTMSETGFKTNLKQWEREDETLRNLRRLLNMAQSEIQGSEYDVDLFKVRARILGARMEELGGYLNYLAAVMNQAEKKTNPTESRSE